MKQELTEMKEEMDKTTRMGGEFHASLSKMNRTTTQKIQKKTEHMTKTINQIN